VDKLISITEGGMAGTEGIITYFKDNILNFENLPRCALF